MKIDLSKSELVLIGVELSHALKSINELIRAGEDNFIGEDEQYLKIIEKIGRVLDEQAISQSRN